VRQPGEWQFPPLALIRGICRADRIQVTSSPKSWPSDELPVAMRLLADGVPLRLLLDLAALNGPDSEVIAASEEAGPR
jgi:hypothetical protein